MFARMLVVCLAAVSLFGQAVNPDARDLLNRGVAAFKDARYAEATALFEQAAAADPGNQTVRLYLATAYMSRWIPGSTEAENVDLAGRAHEQFEAVVAADPKNVVALSSLAMLAFNQAPTGTSAAERGRYLDEAAQWQRRVLDADPKNKQAWYSLGVIEWSRAYPEFQAARKALAMKPEDPGPLRDFNARSDLANRFAPAIADGIKDLQQALTIDPQYDDAMAYMNLLYRLRADLAEGSDQYYRDIAQADEWVNKTLAIKRAKAGATEQSFAPPPPPPPPGSPQRIRVGGTVQEANLVQRMAPVYPREAKEQGVQGDVLFTVVIGRDGRVKEMQLVNGHPLLVTAAQDAIKQWVYKPTLLNGQPVEVVTQVHMNFTLSQ